MANAYYGAGGAAAAAAAAIAQAIKASGAIVRVEPPLFQSILSKVEDPLVVTARGGFRRKKHDYLTSYNGLVFFARSPTPLRFSGTVEVITVRRIWIPD